VAYYPTSQPLSLLPCLASLIQSGRHYARTRWKITVDNYGSEDQQLLEALSYAGLKIILKLTPDNETILRMIKFIHVNDDHPENTTVRLGS